MENDQNQDVLEMMVQETYDLLEDYAEDIKTAAQETIAQSTGAVAVSASSGPARLKQDDHEPLPGPGVVYAVQFSSTAFILRMLPLPKSSDFFRPDSTLRLKFIGELKQANLPAQLYFFPTDYFELAEVITENFSVKRFPLNDDLAYDFDQFKGTWWLREKTSKRFELRFSYPGEVARGRYLKLGPLGDTEGVALIFDRARSLMAGPFHLQGMDISERKIILEGGNSEIGPEDLFDVITGAKPVTWLYEKTQGALGARFFRFLKEMQTMVTFWQEVEQHVATHKPAPPSH